MNHLMKKACNIRRISTQQLGIGLDDWGWIASRGKRFFDIQNIISIPPVGPSRQSCGLDRLIDPGNVCREVYLIERTNKMQPCSRIYYYSVS